MEQQRSDVNVDSTQTEFTQNDGYWWAVEGIDRWTMYARLQELDVTCRCQAGEPLRVRIDSPQDLLHCWSVMRHAAFDLGHRQVLIEELEN